MSKSKEYISFYFSALTETWNLCSSNVRKVTSFSVIQTFSMPYRFVDKSDVKIKSTKVTNASNYRMSVQKKRTYFQMTHYTHNPDYKTVTPCIILQILNW